MDWTDVHYRQLARLISKHTYLYTEMVVDSTLIHNPNTDKCGPRCFQGRPRCLEQRRLMRC
jgi:tRNA-dihydrouridine synthase